MAHKSFDVLDEAMLRKIAALEDAAKSAFDPSTRHGAAVTQARYDARRRQLAESMVEHSSPELRDAIALVKSGEERIRQARRSGIPAGEINKVVTSVRQGILQRLEKQRLDALKAVYAKLTETVQRYDRERDVDPTRSLLALRRAELRYADHDERAALGRLEVLRARGTFDESELLVLGSKGKAARAAVNDLIRDLPAGLANERGRILIDEAEQLVALPSGHVQYTIEGSPTPQAVGVLDLLDPEVTPTAADFATVAD